jgi:hypothetical protein
MARVGRVLERVAPEPEFQVPVHGDTDPLERVHVKARHAALDPADDLAFDAGEVSEVLLGPVPAESRRADLAAELSALFTGPSVSFNSEHRTPAAAHDRFRTNMIAG